MDRRITILILSFFMCLYLTNSQAQENKQYLVYEVNWRTEFPTVGGGFLVGGVDLLLSRNVEALSEQEILNLDRNDVNQFDRDATFQWSTGAGKFSDVLEYSALALPIPLLLSDKVRRESGEIFLMYGETLLINTVLTSLVKLTTQRVRPFVYNEEVSINRKFGKSAKESFYSGHTSHAATMSFFTAKIYADMYPDAKSKVAIWTLATAYPAVMGYLRYKAGKHYPTDVIVGCFSGALVGYLIPHLHKRNLNLPEGLSLATSNGLGLSYRF